MPERIQNDALFRTLIATAVYGIMVIDERGCIIVYNEACERLFGYRPEEVMGPPSPYWNGTDH
jgi:two-component system sensor kinase FixL